MSGIRGRAAAKFWQDASSQKCHKQTLRFVRYNIPVYDVVLIWIHLPGDEELAHCDDGIALILIAESTKHII